MCALKLGDVLEILLPKERWGYAVFIHKDGFGHLFGILSTTDRRCVDIQTLAGKEFKGVFYVNTAGIVKRWKHIGRIGVGGVEIPPVFNGTPSSFWTVYRDGTAEEIDAKETSFEQMLNNGNVHRALWLPLNIEEYLLGSRELKWKWQ